jgi:hypothetical protein
MDILLLLYAVIAGCGRMSAAEVNLTIQRSSVQSLRFCDRGQMGTLRKFNFLKGLM